MPMHALYKVIQPMQHLCIKNVACKETLGAKRYKSEISGTKGYIEL